MTKRDNLVPRDKNWLWSSHVMCVGLIVDCDTLLSRALSSSKLQMSQQILELNFFLNSKKLIGLRKSRSDLFCVHELYVPSLFASIMQNARFSFFFLNWWLLLISLDSPICLIIFWLTLRLRVCVTSLCKVQVCMHLNLLQHLTFCSQVWALACSFSYMDLSIVNCN